MGQGTHLTISPHDPAGLFHDFQNVMIGRFDEDLALPSTISHDMHVNVVMTYLAEGDSVHFLGVDVGSIENVEFRTLRGLTVVRTIDEEEGHAG